MLRTPGELQGNWCYKRPKPLPAKVGANRIALIAPLFRGSKGNSRVTTLGYKLISVRLPLAAEA